MDTNEHTKHMAPRKKITSTETASTEPTTEGQGLSRNEIMALARAIALDASARNGDRLDALKLLLEKDGSTEEENQFHIFLEDEYRESYNATKPNIPQPPPVVIPE